MDSGGDIEPEDDDTAFKSGLSAVTSDSTLFQELLARVASAPPANALPEGALVGEYRIVKALGRGAFGAVYHAIHAVIGKQVAIKVLGAQFSEDTGMARRFVDEARAVNRISHPNIVDIFGFGVLADGRKYCVMELLRGATLAERVNQVGPLPVSEALEILKQIADALDAAHQAGIVHRDLKPENVFLCDLDANDGSIKVKLLDFGIAQIADGLHERTGSNMVLGTPAYMSPEQCRGARIDSRSDIYSLGVLAFELFTGALPFQGANALQVISQHLSAEPPPPSSRRADLPATVDDALLSMLAKVPAERPQSASEAVRQLNQAWQGFRSATRSASVPPRFSQSDAWAERKKAPLRLIGVALGIPALAAAVLSGANTLSHKSSGSEPTRAGQAAPRAVTGEQRAPEVPVQRVTLTVVGEPASAQVFRDNRRICRLGEPFEVDLSDVPFSLTVKAPGYTERTLDVVPTENRELPVKLKRLIAPRRSDELEF